MSKKTKVKKSIRLTSMAILVTGLVISPIKSNSPTAQVNKTPSPQTQNLQASTSTISLINGSFESPVVSSRRTYDIFAATSVPGWKTTDSSGKIEIQKNGFVSGTQTMYAQSGRQWAELNAYENAALYQDIPTTPGTKIHWQVYHKGRKGTDVALVEFGTPGATLVEQTEMSDSDTEWGLYKGTYIIPEGQTTTRFQFRAISSSDGSISSGNYLDDVQFAPASNLAVTGTFSESSIQAKNQVNYQIQATNNGGMVAATNHFSVQIPEELTYTPGTLSSSDTSITGENYDPATRTLTFETGSIGAANSINITLPLTGEVVTPAATPDTTVNYSDKNFEDEISTAEAADSSVEITSNEAPTITGEANTTLQPGDTFDPLNTITATDKEDGDITSSVKVTSNPVDTSKPGTYEVIYEVTDSDNNAASFRRTVVVTEAPVISGDSETRLTPNDTFDPMSTIQATDKEDGDITSNVKITKNTVDTSKPGTYEVMYEVTDSDGNKANFTRTVVMTEAPTITGDSETKINPNSTFDPLSTMQAADKEDGDITSDIQVVDNPVDTSKPGSYEVAYEVTDSDGNKANFTRTVIVTQAPVISGDSETILNPNATFDPMNTMIATDKEDGDITGDIQVVDNPVDTSKPGSYEVAYEVTDSDGNKSTFTRTITVTEPPRISGESETYLSPNATFDPMNTMTATDKEDGNITSSINVTNNTVDTSKPGNYEVTYEVTDSDGNKASFTRTVVVTEAPIITGDSETQLNPNADFDPMSTIQATDKEDGDITNAVKVTNNTVDTSKPGSYFVTYEVIDSDGNISDTFIRTVIVTEAPTISGDSETHIKPEDHFDPMEGITATDKENGDLTEQIKIISNNVDVNVPGNYQVVYEVTDSDGNVTTFTSTVVVDLINQPSERSKDTTNPPKDMQSGKNEVEKKIIETKSDAKTEEKVSLPKTGDQSNTPTGLAGLGLLVVGLFAFFRIKK